MCSDLHERLRTSEVDARVREELLAALRRVNEELGKAAAAARTSTPPAGESGTPEETP